MEPSDLDLWQAAAGGDHEAFHALVDRHARSLFRVALSLSETRCDAEDICQETFAAAFRGLKGFDGRASFKTWITRILMGRAATLWKKQRHARQTLSLHQDEQRGGDGRADPGGKWAEQLSRPSGISAVDQRLDVYEAIRMLPAGFREVIVLREVQGMSYDEIAAALGVPRGTVESRLFRARAELRKKLTGYQAPACDEQ